jgi:hypothetical protein
LGLYRLGGVLRATIQGGGSSSLVINKQNGGFIMENPMKDPIKMDDLVGL